MSYMDYPCFSEEEIKFAKIEAEQAGIDAGDADKARDNYYEVQEKELGEDFNKFKREKNFMEEIRRFTKELIESRLWLYFNKNKVDFMIQSNIDVKLGKKTIQQIRSTSSKMYDISRAAAIWKKRDKIYNKWNKNFTEQHAIHKIYRFIGYPDFKSYG